MELNCWHAKSYEENKSLCQCTAAGVKAFLFLADDLTTGIVVHSGDNAWQQAVLENDISELAGKRAELLSFLKGKGMQPYLPKELQP